MLRSLQKIGWVPKRYFRRIGTGPNPEPNRFTSFWRFGWIANPLYQVTFYIVIFIFLNFKINYHIFIRIRDEACDHGEILQSRALMYTKSDLMKSVEKLKGIKQESEVKYFFVLSFIKELHKYDAPKRSVWYLLKWNYGEPTKFGPIWHFQTKIWGLPIVKTVILV